MTRLPPEILDALAAILADRPPPPGKYSAQVARAVAANHRALMVVYVLLLASTVFLLFQVEVSPWAGAAMIGAFILFVIGLLISLVRLSAYHKALLIADAIHRGQEFLDHDPTKEKATAESVLHETVMARQLQSSESYFLVSGLLAVGAAVVIDHWPFAWRALALLAAGVVFFFLKSFIVHWFGRARRGDANAKEAADHAEERKPGRRRRK